MNSFALDGTNGYVKTLQTQTFVKNADGTIALTETIQVDGMSDAEYTAYKAALQAQSDAAKNPPPVVPDVATATVIDAQLALMP